MKKPPVCSGGFFEETPILKDTMDFTNPTSAIDPLVCAPSAAPVTITNKQFMQTVFGKQPGSTWVAGFKGSPQTKEARWGGEPYLLGSALNLPSDGNTYF